jgi:hypothetical protein
VSRVKYYSFVINVFVVSFFVTFHNAVILFTINAKLMKHYVIKTCGVS